MIMTASQVKEQQKIINHLTIAVNIISFDNNKFTFSNGANCLELNRKDSSKFANRSRIPFLTFVENHNIRAVITGNMGA